MLALSGRARIPAFRLTDPVVVAAAPAGGWPLPPAVSTGLNALAGYSAAFGLSVALAPKAVLTPFFSELVVVGPIVLASNVLVYHLIAIAGASFALAAQLADSGNGAEARRIATGFFWSSLILAKSNFDIASGVFSTLSPLAAIATTASATLVLGTFLGWQHAHPVVGASGRAVAAGS